FTILRRGGPCRKAGGMRRLLPVVGHCWRAEARALRRERTGCTPPSHPHSPAVLAGSVARGTRWTDASQEAPAAGLWFCRASLLPPDRAAWSFRGSCKPLAFARRFMTVFVGNVFVSARRTRSRLQAVSAVKDLTDHSRPAVQQHSNAGMTC